MNPLTKAELLEYRKACKDMDYDGPPLSIDRLLDTIAALESAEVARAIAQAKLEESERWYKEFVWPWRADDEDTDLRGQEWITANRRAVDAPEGKSNGN